MGCAFRDLEDDPQDSAASHITFDPQLGRYRQGALAICTFHLGFGLVRPSKMSVKRIVRGLRSLLLPHSDVHTWDDGEVAVEVFGERGRRFLLLCEPGGNALCVVTVNNVTRRTPYVNDAENLGHWGGVIVVNLYYAQDRRGAPLGPRLCLARDRTVHDRVPPPLAEGEHHRGLELAVGRGRVEVFRQDRNSTPARCSPQVSPVSGGAKVDPVGGRSPTSGD